MNKTIQTTLFWILAFVITIGAVVYQRTTGPTYPKKATLEIENEVYNFKLIRSNNDTRDCPVEIKIPNDQISATLLYRRFPTNDAWQTDTMNREGDILKGFLPGQPAAGKVEYKINFYKNNQLVNNPEEFHTVVRFKDVVPSWVLWIHVPAMFIAMFLSNFVAIMALAKRPKALIYAWICFGFLLIGGMIFGPILQWYAFGDLWTGVPFGWDLTDNKTLIAFLVWAVALLMNRKETKFGWLIAAAAVTLIIFSIPHSMFGSELDYASGTVTQG
ncbi:MAG: hypothetical protein JEZ09_20075 [Salinivirgaceae bacterium]|nr:hypothetical protein [Salinivirgaceae bacterium]